MNKQTKIRIIFILVVLILFGISMQIVYYSIPVSMRTSTQHILYEETYALKIEEEEEEVIIPEIIEEEPIIEEEVYVPPYDEETVDILTNLLYGEARGVKDKAHQAAVIWVVLNRVDAGYGDIIKVATAKNQFTGYKAGRTYTTDIAKKCYNQCREIVIDVLDRYYTEEQEGRVIPKDYLYFRADKTGLDNVFRNKFKGDYTIWDWSLESPYK